jgi:hypothetical protein
MRRKFFFSLLFLAVGLILAAFSEYCFSKSGLWPVSIPMRSSTAHLANKFLPSASARYRIGVAFDKPEKLVFAKPDCVDDPYDSADKCSGLPARLKASWTLSQGNRVIAHGSAAETIWRGQGQPFLGFGTFQAEAWQWYRLEVNSISYETPLAQANPRLTVEIWTEKSFLYGPGFLAVKYASRIIYGLCLFIGGLLILSSVVARREALFAPLR